MKTLGKLVVFALIAAVFVGAILLAGQTNWADGVRETVRQARAARRAKMEAANAQKGAAQAPVPALPEKTDAASVPVSSVGKRSNDRAATAEKASPDAQDAPKSNAPKTGRKGPGPKPPQFTAQAFAAFGGHFAAIMIAALVSGLFLAFIRKRRAKKTKNR